MKQKDIVLIGVVIVASAIISLVFSNYIFATPADRQQKVEVAGPISTTFTTPSSTYFNSNSIDPTQTIQVGINANQSPFGSTAGQ
jgi:hypothetical protein